MGGALGLSPLNLAVAEAQESPAVSDSPAPEIPVAPSPSSELQSPEVPPVAAESAQPKEKKLKDTLRIRGRLQSGWQMTVDNNTGSWSDSFYLRRARLDGRWTPVDWAKLVLEMQFDLADGLEARDVYGEFSFAPWLNLTLGHFKKPFSRLRLMSPYDLVIPDRGLLDDQVVGDTKYGGFGARDIGAMLSGELEGGLTLYKDPLKFSWDLGVFNNLPTEGNYHRDLVARAQLRLFKGLVLATNASFKFYEESSQAKSASMLGGDLKWELDPFRLQLEGAFGDNVNTGSKLWGAHAIASYEIPLKGLAFEWMDAWILTPALMLEAFDPDISANEDLDLRAAAALNLDLTQQIRLVLSLDKIWTDIQASNSALPDPLTLKLQSNLRF